MQKAAIITSMLLRTVMPRAQVAVVLGGCQGHVFATAGLDAQREQQQARLAHGALMAKAAKHFIQHQIRHDQACASILQQAIQLVAGGDGPVCEVVDPDAGVNDQHGGVSPLWVWLGRSRSASLSAGQHG